MDFPKNFDYKTHHVSNYTRLIEPKIVMQYFLVSLFHSANTIKMYMTLRAAQYCLAGRMWLVGRGLENPGYSLFYSAVQKQLEISNNVWPESMPQIKY